MKPRINKENGFSIISVASDCEYEVFHKTANVIEQAFNCHFYEKIEGLDSHYWKFRFKQFDLTLHYNTNLGVEVYSTLGRKSGETENAAAERFATDLFHRLIIEEWHPFLDGKTIGEPGFRGGIILFDKEHPEGARITMDQRQLYFSVRIHLYGRLLHVVNTNTRSESEAYIQRKMFQINKIFEYENVEAQRKNESWQQKYKRMVEELVF